jgi:hypothetical protein
LRRPAGFLMSHIAPIFAEFPWPCKKKHAECARFQA